MPFESGAICENGGGCFVADTLVLTGGGAEEPIQDVKVGDSVMSRDQFDPTAPAQPETVTAVYVHTAYDLRDVTVVGAGGSSEVIRATAEHPFYVQGLGWVGAAQLVAGEKLEEPDGSLATVAANIDEPRPEGVSVYNFEVAPGHTYFVSQGGDWVWVHNTCVLGGAYKDVRAANIGGEVHHMPAYSAVVEALGEGNAAFESR